MAQSKFVIEVINVSAESEVKTAAGGYRTIEIAFKKQGKTDGKKLVDFTNKEVYKFFNSQNLAGKSVRIVSEKKDGEKYWNWISAELSTEATETGPTQKDGADEQSAPGSDGPSAASGAKGATGTRGRVTGSNYETPAERALRREADRVRQFYIVRQSSITSAIEICKTNTGKAPVKDVLDIADALERHVFRDVPAAPKAGVFDDMKDDLPF